jgi:hypothetical protein
MLNLTKLNTEDVDDDTPLTLKKSLLVPDLTAINFLSENPMQTLPHLESGSTACSYNYKKSLFERFSTTLTPIWSQLLSNRLLARS